MLVETQNVSQCEKIFEQTMTFIENCERGDGSFIPEYLENPSFKEVLIFGVDPFYEQETTTFHLEDVESLEDVIAAIAYSLPVEIIVPQNISDYQTLFLEKLNAFYGLLMNNTEGPFDSIHPFGSLGLVFEECDDPMLDRWSDFAGIFYTDVIANAANFFRATTINDPAIGLESMNAVNRHMPHLIPMSQFYMISGYRNERGRYSARDSMINFDVGFSPMDGLLRLEALHDGLKFTALNDRREEACGRVRERLQAVEKIERRMEGYMTELDLMALRECKARYLDLTIGRNDEKGDG